MAKNYRQGRIGEEIRRIISEMLLSDLDHHRTQIVDELLKCLLPSLSEIDLLQQVFVAYSVHDYFSPMQKNAGRHYSSGISFEKNGLKDCMFRLRIRLYSSYVIKPASKSFFVS